MASALIETAGRRRAPIGLWTTWVLAATGLALAAVALGWMVASYDGFGLDIGSAALLTAAVVGCAVIVAAGAVPCLAGMAVVTVASYGQPVGELGSLALSPSLVFYAGLVAWWLLGVIGRAQSSLPVVRPRVRFGQAAALAFLGYTAFSLFHAASSDPAALGGESLISWLRLMYAASIAFLAATMIRSKRDVKVVLGAISAAAVLAVVLALVAGGDVLSGREGGIANVHVTGLLSGLIVVIGSVGAVTTRRWYRVTLVVVGVLGLLVTKSVGSYVAVALALAIGAAFMPPVAPLQRATRLAAAAALAGVLVFGAVQLLRPEVTPGTETFDNSSAARRILAMTAGVEIFERHPVIGAGWRQSRNPELIGDRDVVLDVRRRFPDGRSIYYTDVNPTHVHNTYVQILAEMGLVGFALFAGLIATIAFRARNLLRGLHPGDDLRREAWAMALGLLLLLVWLNDRILGGPLEAMIAALLLGTLAATSRIVGVRRT